MLSCSRGQNSFGCPFFLVLTILFSNGHVFRAEAEADQSLMRRMAFSGGDPNLLKNSSSAGKVPLVIAEGGSQYLYPVMTMRAYEAAMDEGADFLVCMLAITMDSRAICHPTPELSSWTNINDHPKLADRKYRFKVARGVYSFNFTLAELRTLRVLQNTEGRTKAFDRLFQPATPEEVIDAIRNRQKKHPSAKPVGIALEISSYAADLEAVGIRPSAVTYAINLLKQNNWMTLDAPAMIVSTVRSDLAAFVRQGLMVRRLLRDLPAKMEPMNLAGDPNFRRTLRLTAVNATGIMLHVDSILSEKTESFWNKQIQRVGWEQQIPQAADEANLSVFVWGFKESDWSEPGPHFNTFLSDPLRMYRSLLYQAPIAPFIAGVATNWPATAAKAAACYKDPVPLHPSVGLAVDRPLVIASGGAVGLLPAHTSLAYQQAIIEGADFLDCNIQVSKDGVLFCLESAQLSRYTDVDMKEAFAGRQMKRFVSSLNKGGLRDWWSFDFTWEEIKTLTVIPRSRNDEPIKNSPRADLFYNALPPVSFEELISIAQSNTSRAVGIFVKLDYPTYIRGEGREKLEAPQDQIVLLFEILKARGYLGTLNTYDPAHHRPLLIATADGCGLARMHALSSGTLPLVKRIGPDMCEAFAREKQNSTAWWLSSPGLKATRAYAIGISPQKRTFMSISGGSKGGYLMGVIDPNSVYSVASYARAQNLNVYPRVFRNDVVPGDTEGAYDFQNDPTVELQYYFDGLNVLALEAQFVATATGFLESSCRSRPGFVATDPGFNITTLQPGALALEILAYRGRPNNGGQEVAILAGVASAVTVLIVGVALLVFFIRRRKQRMAAALFRDSIYPLTKLPKLKLFTNAELLAATSNFSNANRLGVGGYGTVYKGVLPNGRVVAVKKLHMEIQAKGSVGSNDGIRQLLNEVDIIGTIHNRNIVPLEGVCLDKEVLLVYEFMRNGSLHDAIFNPDYHIQLDWKQWFNLAVGTARGLAYLHTGCEHKVLHRDIKPANILIDDKLNPRLADFGLARNVPISETHITTRVMGSFGFMAPEYAATGQLTEKGDTYSYGILLLTIITGRPPIPDENDPSEQQTTLEWVKEKARLGPKVLLSTVHPKFEGKYDGNQAIIWLYTALLCAQNNPAMRPSMGDVVQMLMGEREIPRICFTPAEFIFPDYESSENSMEYSRFSEDPSYSVTESVMNDDIVAMDGQ